MVMLNRPLKYAQLIRLTRELSEKEMEAARRIAAASSHVELGGNPMFNALYMEHMMFPERD